MELLEKVVFCHDVVRAAVDHAQHDRQQAATCLPLTPENIHRVVRVVLISFSPTTKKKKKKSEVKENSSTVIWHDKERGDGRCHRGDGSNKAAGFVAGSGVYTAFLTDCTTEEIVFSSKRPPPSYYNF